MKEYLIRDKWTGKGEWVRAASIREALVKRGNELRAQRAKGHTGGPLQPNSKASHYSNGDMVDVSLGDVECSGLRGNVIREIPELVSTFEYADPWAA